MTTILKSSSLRSSGLSLGLACFSFPECETNFRDPVQILTAHRIEDVIPTLQQAQDAVDRGQYAAGFVAYEAAPAFDDALRVHSSEGPLVWLGIYDALQGEDAAPCVGLSENLFTRAGGMTEVDYTLAHERIRKYIAAGDAYQVNFTFPLGVSCNSESILSTDRHARGPRASAVIHCGDTVVYSMSPELFFSLEGDRIVTRPMKGTAERGLDYDSDQALGDALGHSEKDRAENVMIVDLLRNDLGRVAETGTVTVEKLFEVERHPTVWQMTSTVSARTKANVPEIFRALFPCGSVTGAPKVRAMEIINELEEGPRGVYCGALGWWGPMRQAHFNVGIRTLSFDVNGERAVYPVGSAITWGSEASREYAECRLKAEILESSQESFDLFESLLWDGSEYYLLDQHLARMSRSADYFGFLFQREAAHQALQQEADVVGKQSAKVRIVLSDDGRLSVSSEPPKSNAPVRLPFAKAPVDSSKVFLYHKTTARKVYDDALVGSDAPDALLWNERGEVTESTVANIVVELDGRRLTPKLSCGLLPGVMREQLIASGEVEEAVLSKDDVRRATRIYLINSVRKWRDATLVT